MRSIDEMLGGELLDRSFACECGRNHFVPTRQVAIEDGIIDRTAAVLSDLVEGDRVLIVADRRTWQVAGERLQSALRARYTVADCIVPDDPSGEVHASVQLVDELAVAFPDSFDVYAAVGSGTINDITKELAHRRGRPYVVVATAASMNGYTSSIVALLDEGVKTTGPATPPVVVLADPEVLLDAPLELTLAGLGDVVSKPFCGCDWWIASLVKGESYCPTPGRILDEAFAGALDMFPRLGAREPGAVMLLAKLLVISGISMTIAGTSSPASGGEHLLSHYWDMTNLRDGRPLQLHGAQVGVASLAMDALYATVLDADFAGIQYRPTSVSDSAKQEVDRVFGSLAEAVWPQWRAKLADRSERDLALLAEHEGAIKSEIRKVLDTGSEVRRAMQASGTPMWAADLGIPASELESALRHGRKIRSRYTILDVAAELGVLDDFAAEYPTRGPEGVEL
jgi:glycerol-1-phosphate dehydrogenase [NAD(P)+]